MTLATADPGYCKVPPRPALTRPPCADRCGRGLLPALGGRSAAPLCLLAPLLASLSPRPAFPPMRAAGGRGRRRRADCICLTVRVSPCVPGRWGEAVRGMRGPNDAVADDALTPLPSPPRCRSSFCAVQTSRSAEPGQPDSDYHSSLVGVPDAERKTHRGVLIYC